MKRNATVTKLTALCLALLMLLPLTACGSNKAPKIDEVRDTVTALVEASYRINALVYGVGLPYVTEGDEDYAFYAVNYPSPTEGYAPVRGTAWCLSEDTFVTEASAVYSTVVVNQLRASAFIGMATTDLVGQQVVITARYIDDGTWLYASTDPEDILIAEQRAYDFSTMKIVKPSTATSLKIEVETYLPSNPGVREKDVISVVFENGAWRLDALAI